MAERVLIRIRIPTRNPPWAPHHVTILRCSPLRPAFHSQSWWRRPPETLKMAVTGSSNSKRPTCPSCTRPILLCLCAKLRYPSFENKVSVTILQHSLETKHPINSARIAKIGLKNVDVLTVYDVQFDARFVISIPGSGLEPVENRGSSDLNWVVSGRHRKVVEGFDFNGSSSSMSMSIGKGGKFMDCQWMGEKVTSFHEIVASPAAEVAMREGLMVRKFNKRKKLYGSEGNVEEYLEFELKVPAGSVLLYPSDESVVSVDELRGGMNNFEVKNLIVLDGTWSKAKKVYKENPWLKLLPHLKLDLGKSSLFSDVRRQPKSGCLSTIESIVYALKAAGEEPEERLDGLLEVFSSMVAEQRRFKAEKLGRASSPLSAETSVVDS
ncbi:unnamed protein product [Linum trigynum]|uniref:tRNA-uridine aminocarboxypropyltransferase n=1 Tax=Linum trigynum TaxID=586398 RepID=A0AAV2CE70_9ROSI